VLPPDSRIAVLNTGGGLKGSGTTGKSGCEEKAKRVAKDTFLSRRTQPPVKWSDGPKAESWGRQKIG